MSEIKDTQHPKVEIAVKNFGPIAEANIDLRPLTVFVGPSNTGKTYFATLVYALHSIFFNSLTLLSQLRKTYRTNFHHIMTLSSSCSNAVLMLRQFRI